MRVELKDFGTEFNVSLDALPHMGVRDSSNPSVEQSEVIESLKAIITNADASVERSLLAVAFLYCCLVPDSCRRVGCRLTVKSDIPIGAGLGSSAAFSVAASTAVHLIRHCGAAGDPADHVPFVADYFSINHWALQAEKLFHATPSGIDNCVCTYGGIVKFQGGSVERVTVGRSRIILVNSQVSRQTRKLVQMVRDRWNAHRNVVDPVLQSIDQISHELVQVVQKPAHDFHTIQVYMILINN